MLWWQEPHGSLHGIRGHVQRVTRTSLCKHTLWCSQDDRIASQHGALYVSSALCNTQLHLRTAAEHETEVLMYEVILLDGQSNKVSTGDHLESWSWGHSCARNKQLLICGQEDPRTSALCSWRGRSRSLLGMAWCLGVMELHLLKKWGRPSLVLYPFSSEFKYARSTLRVLLLVWRKETRSLCLLSVFWDIVLTSF